MPDEQTAKPQKPAFSRIGREVMHRALEHPLRQVPARIGGTPEEAEALVEEWLAAGWIRQTGTGYTATASGANAYLVAAGRLGRNRRK